MENPEIKTALMSVSDKSGLLAFARGLAKYQIHILSTGGTYNQLNDGGVQVQEVSDYTGFPEIMDGRVKTLHPKIHGGLLARRNADGTGPDVGIMAENQIEAIDLVVVNLYPFEKTVALADCSLADAIENIDIGGPAMVRSGAKNFVSVAVIVDVDDYPQILKEMERLSGCLSEATRFRLAVKAFEHVSRYDAAISNYLGSVDLNSKNRSKFPNTITRQYVKKQSMRYGENPHQAAAFYVDAAVLSGTVGAAEQSLGKDLSYNNVADTDAALACVSAFSDPACVIVKHANPCGVATASKVVDAFQRAFETDPTSSFGGIIAFNRDVDADVATDITRQFVEVVIAPKITEAAKAVFSKRKNIRVLECGELAGSVQFDQKKVVGGLLVQEMDLALLDEASLKVVTERDPTIEERRDLMFAWIVAKYVKSNAIVYAKDNRTIGIGAGQMSRVYSAKIAALKAHDEKLIVTGSVMASDAFFPFRDGIDAASEVGITAVIQPGGSVRDEEVIQAANEAGMAMMFTGMRHFRH